MNTKEVISWFEKRMDNITMPGARSMYAMAIDALREQEKRRWIPVTERLPKDECRCLVFDAASDIEMDVYDGEGTFRLERCGAMQHPSYWMPLPEPPEEV